MYPGTGRACKREKIIMRGSDHFFLAKAKTLQLFIFIFSEYNNRFFAPKSALRRFFSSPLSPLLALHFQVVSAQLQSHKLRGLLPWNSSWTKLRHLFPAHSGLQCSFDVGNTEKVTIAHPDACCTQNPRSEGDGKCVTFTTNGFPACF